MNQYPAGFVPMMVPQQYMVMPGTALHPQAIPGHHPQAISGHLPQTLSAHPHAAHASALQPTAMLHQQMAAQVAASHAGGAPVMSPVVTSVGALPSLPVAAQPIGSMQGFQPHLAGLGTPVAALAGGTAQGLHQAFAGGIPQPVSSMSSPITAAGLSQFQNPLQQVSQHASPQLHQLQQFQTSFAQTPGVLKPYEKKKEERSFGRGNSWQTDQDNDVEELHVDESAVTLDHFNSDLNLVIDQDGYGGSVLTDPPGFCFTWAGVRATYGVCRGKVFYEVHILENLQVNFGDDHKETNPHIIRVGWSIDSSSFQLGEEPWSFGYGGTGKFSTNNRFSDYGVQFEQGDVIGAMLDLDSRPASISYTKNGTWYGVAAPLHGFPVGSKEMSLFPHILSKNCRFKVNFGQMDPWFPPPQGFNYIGQLQMVERVRGMPPPAQKADCEMIMIVGLPGAGKTTWGINMQKAHPEKRYNIIGTDTLIDKMRVMGLPRKRNYHGRWDVLIDKSTKCLNRLFTIAAKRKRNYILDQTNVYGSARRRKMKNFRGFYRIAAVLQPDDTELERRSKKRTVEDGKVVPESAVLEMKANFSLPEDRDRLFDRIDYVELPKETVSQLIAMYNNEGKSKPRTDGGNRNQEDTKNPYGGFNPAPGTGRPGQDPFSKRAGSQFDRNDSTKRIKPDPSSALDLLKQQYEEEDRQQQAAGMPVAAALAAAAAAAAAAGTSHLQPGAAHLPPGAAHLQPGATIANGNSPLPPGYPQALMSPHPAALQPGLLGAPPLAPGVQVAFLPPGMQPPGQAQDLASLGLAGATAKMSQDPQTQSTLAAHAQAQAQAYAQAQAQAQAQAHAQAQFHAAAAAAAAQGQILVDPTKLAGSPYAMLGHTTAQSMYGAVHAGLDTSANAAAVSEAQRQMMQDAQPSEQVSQAQWPTSQADPPKSWQDKQPSTTSWSSDWQNNRESNKTSSSGSRDSSYSRYDHRDREQGRERDRERDRDRDRHRDRDYDSSYSRDRSRNSDRTNDRREGGSYSRDSSSSRHHSSSSPSWNQYSNSDHQDNADSSQKGERQRRRKSKWDSPDDTAKSVSEQIKSEPSSLFSTPASSSSGLYNQLPPGYSAASTYSGNLPFSIGGGQQSGHSLNVSLTSGQSASSKAPSAFDISRPPPPLIGNVKTEIPATATIKQEFPPNSETSNSQQPSAALLDIKLPVSGSGDGLLGQGPGPRPLIPGLKMGLPVPPFLLAAPADGNAVSSNKTGTSPSASFSSDKEDGNKHSVPQPLIPSEEMDADVSNFNMPGDQGGPDSFHDKSNPHGKPGLFPTPGTPEADGHFGGGYGGPPFMPRGPGGPGVMGRFPGPPHGPRGGPPGPMRMPGGPPPPGMGHRHRGPPPMGPRGPRMGGPMDGPHHHPRGPMDGPPRGPRGPMDGPPRGPPRGPMDGPPRGPPRGPMDRPLFGPRGPMDGPHHGPMDGPPQGPRGPWNHRMPRFGPRGPRPLFDGPPGRWPRPPR